MKFMDKACHAVLFDHARAARIGLPEAVFCQGKSAEVVEHLLLSFGKEACRKGGRETVSPVLFTRLSPDVFCTFSDAVQAQVDYHLLSQTAFAEPLACPAEGRVAVVSAGTADGPTTWEAARTLAYLGFISYSLDPDTKKLTYKINDYVVECSGEPCLTPGVVYATDGYGFLCLPRNITQQLAEEGYTFEDADAWLDLWCHTV